MVDITGIIQDSRIVKIEIDETYFVTELQIDGTYTTRYSGVATDTNDIKYESFLVLPKVNNIKFDNGNKTPCEECDDFGEPFWKAQLSGEIKKGNHRYCHYCGRKLEDN